MKIKVRNNVPQRKLRLSRETLRRLTNQDLAAIVGGGPTAACTGSCEPGAAWGTTARTDECVVQAFQTTANGV